MIVLRAMLLDAYRELNSRKLFWVTLALTGFTVLSYASMGFNDRGVSMLFGVWTIPNPVLTHGSPLSSILYRSIFSSFMVTIWMAWVAIILALVSTTSLFPDFVAGGSIDLVLSKPIGRIRLFVYKYIAGLLFVLLQVTLFCVGVFICVGWRLGEWDPKILLGIPIVTAMFSYLYAVNVFFGVWRRSALLALLTTLLFWFSLFSLSSGLGIVRQIRVDHEVQIEKDDVTIREIETALAMPGGADTPGQVGLQRQLTDKRNERDAKQTVLDKLEPWSKWLRIGQAILPKTSHTIALLDRYLKKDSDVNILDLMSGRAFVDPVTGEVGTTDDSRGREVARRLIAEDESLSLTYIIGTSLLFEFVLLSLACWIFVRRDY
ncbi:MAG: hypothetical protein GY715_00880 [Planctomycetes bacterium]|nr:hypothetical protein [Planctomycetota bacterium]